ncbi:G2/mitotic-specific cyclin [Leucoagaricus gongylophorus]
MSSTIPTRRAVRVTRSAALKDNENANARPSRIAMRAKPPSGAGITGTGGTTRTTAASRAKSATGDVKADPTAVKRKREALGEVPVNNRPKNVVVKGKEKENTKESFDGVVLKAKPTATRPPLRTVGTKQIAKPVASRTVRKEKEAAVVPTKVVGKPVKDDHAMAVDPPVVSGPIKRGPPPAKDVRQPSKPLYTRESRSKIQLPVEEDDAEDHRDMKRRRTSSETPEHKQAAEEVLLAARINAELEAYANEIEADPENSPWDDLDADDVDDPLMVSEYVVDIFKYLRQVELTTMPNPHYMESQKELAWKMRGILMDWLIQVHVRFRLLPETLFLCVNLIDRFLSARVVSLAKLQLVGVTCLFIASKFEEIISPAVSNFLLCADSTYTESEILQAERYVLKTLDWNLSYPNPVHYLRRVSKADGYDVKVRTLAKYLLEISCLEWRLIAAPPSLMAAASIWLSRLALGYDQWTPNLAHYSGYPESALVPTANLMLNYILKPIRHESFHKKYAGKRYYKSSIYMREWALDRWPEETQVNLTHELSRLKVEIRLEREQIERQLEVGQATGARER